tara:strand:- start:2177 stop:2572 length:396 start_codon:yes stop_codon:yes gene_type:complete
LFIRNFILLLAISGCSSFQEIRSTIDFDGTFTNSDKFHFKKCLSKVDVSFKLYDLSVVGFAENITSEGLEFNTKINSKLSAEIQGREEVLFMESSKVNTTNYISSNMAEEENKRLREQLLDDFCSILLKNV